MHDEGMTDFYDFSATRIDGTEQPMSDYRGQVVLVVNTATQCGLTPQFDGLERLWTTYRDRGLVVLGFPCNQFAGQEPGDNDEVEQVCRINHGVTFPLFTKIEVNGGGTHPLWAWLKEQAPSTLGRAIKWNFTKFLISRDGEVLDRFAPTTAPDAFEKEIVSALDA